MPKRKIPIRRSSRPLAEPETPPPPEPAIPKVVTKPDPIPVEAQIVCVKREIALRKRLYPDWVASKRMNCYKAQEEIQCMEAVLKTLEGLVKKLI